MATIRLTFPLSRGMSDDRLQNDLPVVLVLAAAENGVIGREDALPWGCWTIFSISSAQR